MINVFQPTLGAEELDAVRQVFESAWIGRGPRTKEFEEAFADYLGVEPTQLTSINSCTEGLFLSIELAQIGPGDEVVLPTISFVGAANAVAAHGARPVFCDVDPRSLNPRVDDVLAKLTPHTKAVILLHYGGYPGDVVDIATLCRERGISLIEDAASGVASRVDGQACGTFGDLGAWSFDAMKILVTGDGGMLFARDPELAQRLPQRVYLGLEQVSGFSQVQQQRSRWWEFEVSSFSRRSITNDLASAIGVVQLRRLPAFMQRRRAIAAHYNEGLAGIEVLRCPPPLPPGHESSHWLYWIQLDRSDVRDAVARRLFERGIYTTFRYPPLHKIGAYHDQSDLPCAEHAAGATLCLPMHQALDDADVETVIAEVRTAVSAEVATRSQPTG